MIEEEIDCRWSTKKSQEMFIANITKFYILLCKCHRIDEKYSKIEKNKRQETQRHAILKRITIGE